MNTASPQSSVKLTLKTLLILLSILFIFLFTGIGSSVNNKIESIYSLARGQIKPDTNIVIIGINSNDIETIGPWPIKRSYYALLINNLSKYQVKEIGLEVFLSARFITQSIYDNLLKNEIEKSGRVVLSSVAGNFSYKNRNYVTDSLSYPSPKLLNEKINSGHLNFETNFGIKIPLVIHHNNEVENAFALQLAGNKNVSTFKGELDVNFISRWKKFKHYSLIEFFNLVHNKSTELKKIKGKTILVGITDPQFAVNIQTNFDENIPGVALHAFAVDNILNNRALNNNYLFPSRILFVLLILSVLLVQEKKPGIKWHLFYIISFAAFIITAFILYAYFNVKLAYTAFLFPFIVMAVVDSVLYLLDKKILLEGTLDESQLLKELLHKKETELAKLQKELNISEDSGSHELIEKIKILKADINKLKENKEDTNAAEILRPDEIQNFHGIIYRSKSMVKVVDLIQKTAPEDANILVLGESGTGKELVAKAVHSLGKRSSKEFVAVNCGALSESLLESELFGHVKGAFTGAATDKIGRFEAADKGTIFLDEIAETSENFQVKLLRVIQTGDFEKVGSSKTSHTDVRIIAATNKDLFAAVKGKKFREDLYYRLNVIRIDLPPLRERKEDIEPIALHCLSAEAVDVVFSKAAVDTFTQYNWKGNVRELEAVVKRAVIFAKAEGRKLIQLSDLPKEIVKESRFSFDELVLESLRDKQFSHSSIIETAKELGNVNRTLISENLRGLFFKYYIENNYDIDASVKLLSGSDIDAVNDRVRAKVQTFLSNIENDLKNIIDRDFDTVKSKFKSKYKNLPQKFHEYLDEIIRHYI